MASGLLCLLAWPVIFPDFTMLFFTRWTDKCWSERSQVSGIPLNSRARCVWVCLWVWCIKHSAVIGVRRLGWGWQRWQMVKRISVLTSWKYEESFRVFRRRITDFRHKTRSNNIKQNKIACRKMPFKWRFPLTHWVYGWRDKGETETKFRVNHSFRSNYLNFVLCVCAPDTIKKRNEKKRNLNFSREKFISISCALSSSLQTTPCFTLFISKSPPLAHNAFRFLLPTDFSNANLFVRIRDFPSIWKVV